jgi:N-carbamoylputrescine amidase
MRVTVCELPHEPTALAKAWARLCEHTWLHESELVLLPEFAMVDPVWDAPRFDAARWARAEVVGERWLGLLGELHAEHVVGTRPHTVHGRRHNQGYLWSSAGGVVPLRSKFFMPNEPGGWEAAWFDGGDRDFPVFRAGEVTFGLNVCTELWALETFARYATLDVQLILSPRATAAATTARWLSVGVVAAVRSGAFSVSSNRVDHTGACGGVGWIISPDGDVLGRTSPDSPCITIDIDLAGPAAARASYPRNVFGAGHGRSHGQGCDVD